ncbi:conjugal transfer protein [Nocardia sp. NPDC051463]|uniref:conjugal transfer protein n=1 Tax=Nocardia sp. NPDC051463 TaxID=3154845 RepID=UPI0034463ED1
MRTLARGQSESGEALLRRMAARRRRDNVLVAVLAVLAALGGGHAIFSMFSSGPPPPSDNTTTAIIGRAQLAGSFAQQFVVTYLTSVAGQQDRIGEYVGAGQQVSLPATARQVADPAVVYVSRTNSTGGLDVWSVTVSVRVAKGATVTPADPRYFYRVAVSLSEGRLRALSIPAVVEAPGRGADLALAYSTPCTSETPLAQVASGFLGAMLANSGEVVRYTTQDAGITALKPAPFTAVDLVSVSADDTSCGVSKTKAQVLATVNPKADGGATATLAYPLSMVRNGGQWQVASIDSVPALSNPLAVVGAQDSRGAGTSSSTSTAPPTTTVQIPPAKQN